MKQQLTNKLRGFTIIEVVLVLAIAALIFLLVFLAFPALQRNQRDTQRRSDVARFVSQIGQYQTSNNGNIPKWDDADDFINDYLLANGSKWEDPTGDGSKQYPNGWGYKLMPKTTGDGAQVDRGSVAYYPGKLCNGESASGTGGNRQFAIRIDMEAGGAFCEDNN